MPYIDIRTNISLTDEKKSKLKSVCADILASSFPGKTENWLMVAVSDGDTMYFGGDDAPCLMADVSIFGKQKTEGYDSMTAGFCEAAEKLLGIPADRIYIKYSEYSRWGWNGNNF